MPGEAQVSGGGADGGAAQRLRSLGDLGQEHHPQDKQPVGGKYERSEPREAQGGDQAVQM